MDFIVMNIFLKNKSRDNRLMNNHDLMNKKSSRDFAIRGDYEREKTSKIRLLYLLRAIRLVEKDHNPYLSYHIYHIIKY
jgi:hypothetical protein